MKPKIRVTYDSPLVLIFALVCLIATLLGMIFGDGVNSLFFSTYASSTADPLTYLRVFTHVVGHSGIEHLVGNMSFILLLGPALEKRYGWKKLLVVILVTALITGLIHNLLFPQTALMGASGIVFAFILLTSLQNLTEGEIPLTFILVAAIYLGMQIWDMIAVKDNVSQFTHILGGLVGAGAGYLLNRKNGQSSGQSTAQTTGQG